MILPMITGRGKKTFFMTCSEKIKSGCKARATMRKKIVPGRDGEDILDYELVKDHLYHKILTIY